jgi:hypothetical protein
MKRARVSGQPSFHFSQPLTLLRLSRMSCAAGSPIDIERIHGFGIGHRRMDGRHAMRQPKDRGLRGSAEGRDDSMHHAGPLHRTGGDAADQAVEDDELGIVHHLGWKLLERRVVHEVSKLLRVGGHGRRHPPGIHSTLRPSLSMCATPRKYSTCWSTPRRPMSIVCKLTAWAPAFLQVSTHAATCSGLYFGAPIMP